MEQITSWIEQSRLRAWFAKARGARWVGELPAWCFAIWATSIVIRFHWPYLLRPVEHSVDEGYVIAIGQRMLHGHMLPYVDGVAHTGPVFLYLGALITAFGEFSWLPLRVAAALSFALVSALSFASLRGARRPLAGAIAAAGVPFYVSLRMSTIDALAYNAELPAILFCVAALAAAVRASDDDSRPLSTGWLFTAGVLTALTALSKQIAALIALPIAAYVLVGVFARAELSWRQRRQLALTFIAGGALPAVIIFGQLALHGALKDAYYYMVTYNRYPYMDIFRDAPMRKHYEDWFRYRPLELSLTAVALISGLAQVVVARDSERSWWRAIARSRLHWTVAAIAAGGILGARASQREFEHYYVMVVPGFSLLAGLLVELALRELRRPDLVALMSALVLVPVMYIGELTLKERHTHLTAWWPEHSALVDLEMAYQEPKVCAYIRKHVAYDQKLFVWGFRPQLHVSCGRRPASRFVYSTFLAGYVPGQGPYDKAVDDAYATPGARELAVKELEETKPPVLIESARTVGGRSFRTAGPLWDYIEKHYRQVTTAGNDAVWLRFKKGDRNAPADFVE